MEKQRFCTRPSRLFSGDPSALFAQDSQYFSVSEILQASLSTPFNFQLDTPQVPSSQFWHLPAGVSVTIFTPSPNSVNNLSGNQWALWLCPGSMVGSIFQDPTSGEVNGINFDNVGIQIKQEFANLMNDTNGTHGGVQEIVFKGPIEVPPLWFLRFTIADIEAGANNVWIGTKITLRAQQQIVNLGFETKY